MYFRYSDRSDLSWQCDSLNIVRYHFKEIYYESHIVIGSKHVISRYYFISF